MQGEEALHCKLSVFQPASFALKKPIMCLKPGNNGVRRSGARGRSNRAAAWVGPGFHECVVPSGAMILDESLVIHALI